MAVTEEDPHFPEPAHPAGLWGSGTVRSSLGQRAGDTAVASSRDTLSSWPAFRPAAFQVHCRVNNGNVRLA